MITLCGSCGKPEQQCTCVALKTQRPQQPQNADAVARAIADVFAILITEIIRK